MFSTEQMHFLGNGDMVKCSWDFSKISVDDYNGFFSTLPNILYKKIRHARFCVDYAKSLANNPNATDADVRVLDYSIKEKKPRFSWMLAKVIARTLPRSKLLTTLTISGIPMRHSDVHSIFEAVGKCRTLKRIIFEDMPIRDADFAYLLSVVSPYKMHEISFVNCGLTSDIYQPLVRFFKKDPPSERHDWVFSTLRLEGNNIGGRDFSVIDGMLRQKTDPLADDEIPTFTIEPRETMTMEPSSGIGRRHHTGTEEEGYYEEEEEVVFEEEEYIIEQYEDEEDEREVPVRKEKSTSDISSKKSAGFKEDTDSDEFSAKKSGGFKEDTDSDEFHPKKSGEFKEDSNSDEFQGKISDPEILSEGSSSALEGKLEIEDESSSHKAHSKVIVDMDSALRLQDIGKIDNKSREILEEVIAKVAEVEQTERNDDPWKENENLKRELQELIDTIQAIEFEEDVYVFGPNAKANCELIREVIERLDEYHRESARRH